MAIAASTRSVVYGPLTSYPTGLGTVQSNLESVLTPWGMKVRLHRYIRQVFTEACGEAASKQWKPQRVDSFAPRKIRDSLAISLHAYGLAFDFFATPPGVVPPGGVWTPNNPVTATFAQCFVRRGFRWGATFSRVDVPHIEWPGDRPYAVPPPAPDPPEDDMPPAPAAVTARDGATWAFVRGQDGQLWGQRNYGTWVRYGGIITSGPAAVPNGTDGVMVFARGTDAGTWRAVVNPRTPTDGTNGRWVSEGGLS